MNRTQALGGRSGGGQQAYKQRQSQMFAQDSHDGRGGSVNQIGLKNGGDACQP
jgi:hypothetical protein